MSKSDHCAPEFRAALPEDTTCIDCDCERAITAPPVPFEEPPSDAAA